MNAPPTRGVLLAAGRGTRLGPLTERFPKPLLEVGGSPILHRIIAGLSETGITEIAVVTGHEAGQLEQATGDGSRWGVNIRYFRQSALDGTAGAVGLARRFTKGERFFLGWGDIVVDATNYRRVIEASANFRAVLAVNDVEDPFTGGAVYVDEHSRVTKLIEKPSKGTSSTRWNNAGLMVLPADIWPFIDSLVPSPRGEYELPQALSAYVDSGLEVGAVPIEGPWSDIGTVESLQAARAYFAS